MSSCSHRPVNDKDAHADAQQLTSALYIDTIRKLRNFCAHGKVLFDKNLPEAISNGPLGYLGNSKTQLFGAYRVLEYILGQVSQNRVQDMRSEVKALFDNDENVADFLSHVHEEKIRYYRDQLLEIRRLCKEWDTDTILEAVAYCSERNLYSASELKSAIYFLSKYKEDSVKVANAGIVLLPEKYRGGSPPIRELSLYETVMERSRKDG